MNIFEHILVKIIITCFDIIFITALNYYNVQIIKNRHILYNVTYCQQKLLLNYGTFVIFYYHKFIID